MTLGSQIAWDDTVLPFQLDRADIRGRVARLDGLLNHILNQHAYPAPVEALIAEAVILTALIGQTIKLRWRLSLQLRGDGPVRMIATDYFGPEAEGAPASIRAYAALDHDAFAAASPGAAPFDLLGHGYFGIIIDQGPDMTPYQGITPLAGNRLADCAETYFAQSEQLPTRFAIGLEKRAGGGPAGHWRAGGMMLQHMPKGSPHASGGGSGAGGLLAPDDIVHGEDAENWSRANLLLDTAETDELTGPDVQPTDLLVRLFHEEGPRVFDAQAMQFGCTCSEDRVRQSLSAYSRADLADMVTEAGVITADCQFCNAHYELDPASVGSDAENGAGE
jgi:molecular chaperone Hsp33